MSKINFKFIFIGTLSIFLLTACTSFYPAKTPLVHQYTIAAVSVKRCNRKLFNKVLLVTLPTALPAFQTKNMWYSKGPYQIQSFSYNEWVASPNDMLLPLLVQSLSNSYCFKAVVSPPYSVLSDYRLDTQILDFQQYFMNTGSQFRFVLHAVLVNTITHRIILSKNFSAIVKSAPNPRAGVIAANQAVQQVLDQLSVALSPRSNA